MKRKNVTMDVLRPSIRRSIRDSAVLENRVVPAGAARSARVDSFLAARKKKS